MLPDIGFDIYPIIAVLAVFLAFVLVEVYFKKINMKKGIATGYEILITVSAGIGFLTAILFQNLYDFIENPSDYHWTWAMTFFGGVVGGVVIFIIGYNIFLRKNPKYAGTLPQLLAIAGGAAPLAHCVGRIGCTLDGCCYGAPTDTIFGIEFSTTPGQKVWPTQLFEAIFLAILGTILVIIAFKFRTRKTLPIYMMSYGVWRFLIEFLRNDHRGSFIPGLTPSQFWAIVLFLGGLAYLILILKFKDKYIVPYPQNEVVEDKKEETK